MTYTGISVGYVWGDVETRCKRNLVEYNEIYHVMRMMQDGAGIYTLGRSQGTVIQNNVIYDCHPMFSEHARGIYLDQSSRGIVVRNNIVYDTGDGAVLLHGCRDNVIENNIFLQGHESQAYFCFERGESVGQGNVFRRNIIVYSQADSSLYQMYPQVTPTNCRIDQNVIHCPPQLQRVRISMVDGKWVNPPVTKQPREAGLDVNSVFADPQFVDYAAGDLRLKKTSPALGLGFKAFVLDLSGLRAYMAQKRLASGTTSQAVK